MGIASREAPRAPPREASPRLRYHRHRRPAAHRAAARRHTASRLWYTQREERCTPCHFSTRRGISTLPRHHLGRVTAARASPALTLALSIHYITRFFAMIADASQAPSLRRCARHTFRLMAVASPRAPRRAYRATSRINAARRVLFDATTRAHRRRHIYFVAKFTSPREARDYAGHVISPITGKSLDLR